MYAKQPLGGPEQVLAYLGRYTHRVAISNERIVGIDGQEVSFRVRAHQAGEGKRRTIRLEGSEFIRRFLLHVLPPGFKRIRHYGLLAPAHKNKRLAQARAALQQPEPDPAIVESVAQFMQRVAHLDLQRCPCCGHVGHVGLRLTPLPPTRPASLPLTRGPP
ncbi:MAG: transposase [Uliginosibacterium sp.]|nr:transposase [Uliginosibacterium sp.]